MAEQKRDPAGEIKLTVRNEGKGPYFVLETSISGETRDLARAHAVLVDGATAAAATLVGDILQKYGQETAGVFVAEFNAALKTLGKRGVNRVRAESWTKLEEVPEP